MNCKNCGLYNDCEVRDNVLTCDKMIRKLNYDDIFHCKKRSKFITLDICNDCFKAGIAGFTDHIMCREFNISMVEGE